MAPQPGINLAAVSHVQLMALPAMLAACTLRGVQSCVCAAGKDTERRDAHLKVPLLAVAEGSAYSPAKSEKKLWENMIQV